MRKLTFAIAGLAVMESPAYAPACRNSHGSSSVARLWERIRPDQRQVANPRTASKLLMRSFEAFSLSRELRCRLGTF